MVRVELPYHLRQLAGIPSHEVQLDIDAPATITRVIHSLDRHYPALRNTILDPANGQRRPFLRFFACQQDISLLSLDDPLPAAIQCGCDPLLIIAGIAGG